MGNWSPLKSFLIAVTINCRYTAYTGDNFEYQKLRL